VEEILPFNKFFFRLSIRAGSRTKLSIVRRRLFFGDFLRSATRMHHISHLHSKFALSHVICGSMVDIQSAAAEIRRGKKERKKKPQDENIMSVSAMQGGHNKWSSRKNKRDIGLLSAAVLKSATGDCTISVCYYICDKCCSVLL